MAQSDANPGPHKLLLLISAALRLADELSLGDVAIELNAALEKLGAELGRDYVLRDCASATWLSADDDDVYDDDDR